MTLRRHLVLLLLLPALLLAQWLGQAHGVTHARLTAAVPIGAQATTADAVPVVSAGVIDTLFAGHDAVTCRILDQLGHADLPICVPVLLAPAPLPAFLAPVVTGRLLVALAAGFQARAPPVLR